MTTSAQAMSLGDFLSKTFAVVFDTSVLLLCAVVATVMTVGLGFSRVFLVVGIMFVLFASSALMKYATLVTRTLALGKQVPAADSAIFDYSSALWAFAPWLSLLLLNIVAVGIWQGFGAAALIVFVVLMLPLMPAGIAVVCVSRRPLDVFDLPGLMRVIRILGADYGKILVGWILIATVAALLRSLNGFGFSFLAVMAGCIQLMFVFAATGVVLFHHNKALQIPIERDTRENRQAQYESAIVLRERRTALDQAYVFFSRGNSVGGMQRLKLYLENEDEDTGAWRWFVDEMLAWDSPEPVMLLARNYLTHLIGAGDDADARQLLIDCLAVSPAFKPHATDQPHAAGLLEDHAFAPLTRGWRGQ